MPTTFPTYAPTIPDEVVDVVVVGARLAGAATAMLLARFGLRVIVLERSQSLGDTLSTHAFMRGGVLQLQRWGLLERLRATGTPPVRVTTFTYADSAMPIAIEPKYGVDALYAPRRTVLDPILAGAASEAGADVRYAYRVTGLLRSASGRVVGVSGVRDTGTTFTIRSRFVVGADGLQSLIARLVDARFERRAGHASAITYGYWSGVDIHDYEWTFVENASAGAMPTNDGQVLVFANATPERIGRGGLQVIESILRSSAPDLAAGVRSGRPPTRTRRFRAPLGFLRQAWGDGWALVGDAGYFKDPLTAHGMTDALRDAELLARALAHAFTGTTEGVALADYQRTRDCLSAPLFEITDAIASHQWTSQQIAELLKRLSAAMRDEVTLLAGLDAHDFGIRNQERAA